MAGNLPWRTIRELVEMPGRSENAGSEWASFCKLGFDAVADLTQSAPVNLVAVAWRKSMQVSGCEGVNPRVMLMAGRPRPSPSGVKKNSPVID